MANITLAGRLKNYSGKAMDAVYKTADKLANPVIDRIASIDFAGSYFNNPNIPDFMKYSAFHRNFIADESAQWGRPTPDLPQEGRMDYRKAIGLGLAAAVTFGAIGYAMQKKDIGFDDIDAGIAYAEEKIFSKSNIKAVGAGGGIVGVEKAVANETVKPTETPQPDYVDEVNLNGTLHKVGIMIEGPQSFKDNITTMLNIIKTRAPDRYNKSIIYTPKIVRHERNYNYYASSPTEEIGITKLVEAGGGSKNENNSLVASLELLAEMDNAMEAKTGVEYKDNKEAELATNTRVANDMVAFGLWNNETADNYIRYISALLESGEYHKILS